MSGGTDQGNRMLSDDDLSEEAPERRAEPELSRGDDKDLLVGLLSQALCMVGSESSIPGTQFLGPPQLSTMGWRQSGRDARRG
ncbi:hypothetical protein U1Q18_024124 [Sarracenia purpurea var. burkii]